MEIGEDSKGRNRNSEVVTKEGKERNFEVNSDLSDHPEHFSNRFCSGLCGFFLMRHGEIDCFTILLSHKGQFHLQEIAIVSILNCKQPLVL